MTEERIEFSSVQGNEDSFLSSVPRNENVFPRPYPATKEIPEWLKAMPAKAQGTSIRSVKNCPPFLEAMSCGYIIPVPVDINLTLDAAGKFRCVNMVQVHSPAQVPGAPFANYPVIKILNPWLIRTPPGYSTLFLPLLNRIPMPLYPLAGMVETDIFYREVHFPAVLTIARGTTVKLARGSPLVQVIPIKREDFKSEFVPLDAEKYKTVRENTKDRPENHNYYKNNFWRRKNYH